METTVRGWLPLSSPRLWPNYFTTLNQVPTWATRSQGQVAKASRPFLPPVCQADDSRMYLHVGPSTGSWCIQMKILRNQSTLSGEIKRGCIEMRAVSGKMAEIQDVNWLTAFSSLAAMLMGAACQFCTGSLSLQELPPRGQAVHQLFVTASLQQLLLYVLNLVVMAALLPRDQLKLVPILVAMFIFGRWGLNIWQVDFQKHPYWSRTLMFTFFFTLVKNAPSRLWHTERRYYSLIYSKDNWYITTNLWASWSQSSRIRWLSHLFLTCAQLETV